MLSFKIFDHSAGIWAADHSPGLHCYSEFLLSENGEVTEAIGNYQDEFFSLKTEQDYVNVQELISGDPKKAKRRRFTVCPWTGAKDSNGEKIYAGDIIKESLEEPIGVYKEFTYIVKYDYSTLSWMGKMIEEDNLCNFLLFRILLNKTKVIGSSIK